MRICAILRIANLIDLPPVTASISETGSATGGLAEHYIARAAEDDCLCMTEYGSDLKASRALDIHEKTVRALYKALELVGLGLALGGWVQQIDGHL
mmetsp:Transcript_18642/g.25683  ORF Transcript_18642/g.25683 Transcript_18642/m.25683 type:complete len:96 (-) Transcript_18642:196-483(-)